MQTTWQPLYDEIMVRPLIEADRTASGLFITEKGRERPRLGQVLAVGPGRWSETGVRIPVDVQPGMLVTFGKYAGSDFVVNNQEVYLMRDQEARCGAIQGTYTLVEHEIPHGTGTRTVAHEAGQQCEHCPVEKSAVLEEERARWRREMIGSIDDRPSESSVVGDGTGVR